MAKEIYTSNVEQRTNTMLMVWVSLLWISDLPDILFYYLIGSIPFWLIYVKFALMLVYTIYCQARPRFKPILPYAFIMLVFIGGVMGLDWLKNQSWWETWSGFAETSYFWEYAKVNFVDFRMILFMLAAIWLVKQKLLGPLLSNDGRKKLIVIDPMTEILP